MANLAGSQADLAKLRDNVAAWYDTAMDRLSGDFARQSKTIALGIGLALAVVLNADSVAVTKALWHDQALRAQAVDMAKTTLAGQGPKPVCEQPEPNDRLACLLTGFAKYEESLRPFPIGWDVNASTTWSPATIAFKIFGLLFTGLALSLGAPFWFDLLQKFMSVRGTGPKPKVRTEVGAT